MDRERLTCSDLARGRLYLNPKSKHVLVYSGTHFGRYYFDLLHDPATFLRMWEFEVEELVPLTEMEALAWVAR